MNYDISFPEKLIVKIIISETREKFKNPVYDQEQSVMLKKHIDNIEKLETYKQINAWLIDYRGLSLLEWVKSL